MRLDYSDEEDFPGQFNLWQANCIRSLQGKSGQAALKRLEAALIALPAKCLIEDSLSEVDTSTSRLEVCALGAVAMMEGHEDVLYSNRDPVDAGEAMGFPYLVAWKTVEQNDIRLEGKSPEERYTAMLAWVRSQIRPQA